MRLGQGLIFFSFFTLVLGSCFDPPEFPDTPEIVFDEIYFRDVQDSSKPDTLVLKIAFKDGDGDLGLDPQSTIFNTAPYHYADFFQATGNGSLSKVESKPTPVTGPSGNEVLDILEIDDPSEGTLAFPRTRKVAGYSSVLPGYSCAHYEYREFVIREDDREVLDDESKITEELILQGFKYLRVVDTLYLEFNPNHYNIEVDFLVRVPGSESPSHPDFNAEWPGFVEFDWREEYCSTFDGRFPILSEDEKALDGTLTYHMESRGFNVLFGGKTLKLRVQVKDRALRTSERIFTPEFTLASIRR